ncbi:MAG: hypothetical protein AAF126_00395 [Chloroflexota bacterium]
MSETILDALKDIEQQLRRRNPNYLMVCHIDDCLMALRQFRAQGLSSQRGRTPDGKKAPYFQILENGYVKHMLSVDMHQKVQKGTLLVAPLPSYRDYHRPQIIRNDENLDIYHSWRMRWKYDFGLR